MSEFSESNFSILIVDDNLINIQVLASTLKKYDYQVRAATNSNSAFEMISKALPDIILLDIMMPEMDGFETCKILKASDKTKDIPIIFLTAKADTEDIVKGFEMGAVDYITKPFNIHEMLARVKTHLDLKANKELVEKTNNDLQELLHIICHDLMNPIGFILGVMEVSKEDPSFYEQMKDDILDSAKKSVELIELVRQMRALEENKFSLDIKPINLNGLVEESINMLKDKFASKNIEVISHIDKDIKVDIERISFINSVMNNLLTNAIKFSHPNSKILLDTALNNGNIILSIKDYGIGIPKVLLENLFETSKPTTRKGTNGETGTGFGMPLVQKFMRAYHGEIEVFSNDKSDDKNQSGTEVKLTLLKSGA